MNTTRANNCFLPLICYLYENNSKHVFPFASKTCKKLPSELSVDLFYSTCKSIDASIEKGNGGGGRDVNIIHSSLCKVPFLMEMVRACKGVRERVST